jgi:membrane associated rhomboid family serine protease
MIPLYDENPTLRFPVVTVLLLTGIAAAWVFVQGAGLDATVLAASVCNLGLVPGELTGSAALGSGVPLGPGLACVVDHDSVNLLTPLTSMFLHGGWAHLLGNSLFLWVFGNNVEDSMSRSRFVVFYLLCGLAAGGMQVAVDPASAVPMVGASGAISGVMGAYLLLYPRARVHMLFLIVIFVKVIPLPAWLVLAWWFVLQVVSALPSLTGLETQASSGVAFMAHVGGFLAGLLLVKLFQSAERVGARAEAPRRTRWR